MVPCSTWAVEAYPTEIRMFRNEESASLQLDLTGPVEGFTIEQDLEKNVVRVFGTAKEGYFNFEIAHIENIVLITLKRGNLIPYHFAGKKGVLEKDQFLEIQTDAAFVSNHIERLSLGVNKKLDWDLVHRRCELKEILPLLFFLGQKGESSNVDLKVPVLDNSFIKHHFQNMLFPNRSTDKRLGLDIKEMPVEVSLSIILFKTYESIRALFIKEVDDNILIDTAQFVSGRMIGIKTSKAIIDIEWTKRKLRKLKITPIQSGPLSIIWPKDVDSFRLKHRPQEKGKMLQSSDEIILVFGQITYLDKFQK